MCDVLIRRRVLRVCRRPILAALIFARVAALICFPLFQDSLPCAERPRFTRADQHALPLSAPGALAHIAALVCLPLLPESLPCSSRTNMATQPKSPECPLPAPFENTVGCASARHHMLGGPVFLEGI